MGQTFFDTSEVYGIYASEELVGEALDLSEDDLKQLTAIADNTAIFGGRYAPEMESITGK